MTGRERITAVLEGRATDRLPLNLLFYQDYIAHSAGREAWEFYYGTAQDQFDMVLASARRHPANDGIWTQTGMNRGPIPNMHVEMIDRRPWAVFDDGTRKLLDDRVENSPWNRTPEDVRRGYELARVHEISEIPDKCGRILPAAELARNDSHRILSELHAEIGDETFLWVNFSSLFATATHWLGGPEEAWIATLTQPELVDAVLAHCSRQHLEYVEAAAIAGGHGLWNCFMFEGANILSPDTWRALIKPYAAQHVARAHELGLKHVAWFLDDCRPLVEDLIEIGIDGIATEQPRADYECEPGDLRRCAVSKDVCLFGWFWEEDLLHADRDAIRRTLARQYEQAGSGKPFAVSTPGLTGQFDPAAVDMIIDEATRL